MSRQDFSLCFKVERVTFVTK